MQLVLIRHLPTTWNEKGVLQGKRDIPLLPLTQKYKQEIDQNNIEIDKLQPFDLVLTSSLVRTQQTAFYYGHNQIKIEPLLDELDFGEFEGKKKQLLIEKFQHQWHSNPTNIVLGESLREFEQRIFLFLKKYNHLSKILVFGHGSWIRALLSINHSGSIQTMNQMEVRNNDIITIEMPIYK
jgi:broad specificity phosphatase PhoE